MATSGKTSRDAVPPNELTIQLLASLERLRWSEHERRKRAGLTRVRVAMLPGVCESLLQIRRSRP